MLASDIDDIFPFATFSTLASVILTFRSFPVVLVFRPFPERLACFGQYGRTGWRWQWFTERSMQHNKKRSQYYEKVASPNFKESGNACRQGRKGKFKEKKIAWEKSILLNPLLIIPKLSRKPTPSGIGKKCPLVELSAYENFSHEKKGEKCKKGNWKQWL